MSNIPDSPWLLDFLENGDAQGAPMRLFCFHYAGAGASIFEGWATALADRVELIAIQLPGREDRFDEDPVSDIHQISETVAEDINGLLDKPYAVFGHSIGALIGFDLARVLRRRGLRQPELLVMSGQNAPHVKRHVVTVHQLPDEEFVQVLRDYGGTPEAILENEDLLEFLLPRLRADIAISELYRYQEEEPMDCRIAAFYSTADALVAAPKVEAWEAQTRTGFDVYSWDGNHFFLHTSEDDVLDALRGELDKVKPS